MIHLLLRILYHEENFNKETGYFFSPRAKGRHPLESLLFEMKLPT
jgi:hypothetical protein